MAKDSPRAEHERAIVKESIPGVKSTRKTRSLVVCRCGASELTVSQNAFQILAIDIYRLASFCSKSLEMRIAFKRVL